MPAPERHVVILAGPNGAGKTTAASSLLPDLDLMEFVNADTIARGLSAFSPEGAGVAAGRLMVERLRELAMQGKSFAFETTLASRTCALWLEYLQGNGYSVELIFCWLPSPEMSILRVAQRVRSGGHHVPDDTIIRQYETGLRNFFQLYQPIADRWHMYDTTAQPRLIAQKKQRVVIHDTAQWARLEASYGQTS